MSLDDTKFALLPVAHAVHALLGASSAHQWSSCTAAPGMQRGRPNQSNEASRWGTANHLLSETCLNSGGDPIDHLGRFVAFWIHPESSSYGEAFLDTLLDEHGELIDDTGCLEIVHRVEIDHAQVDCSTTFVTFVRDMVVATGGTLLVEQRVSIEHITGEPGAHGTADVIILVPHQRLIIVIDLKGGLMKVDAFEEQPIDVIDMWDGFSAVDDSAPTTIQTPNLQLAMYGEAAVYEHELFHEFDEIELHIVQPRLNHFSEFRCSVEKLRETIQWLRGRAALTRTDPQFMPSHKNCLFCRAKDVCPARDRKVLKESAEGFGERIEDDQEIPPLGVIYEKLDMIEDWCTGKRKQVRAALLAGERIVGRRGAYKLISGANGDRMWEDPTDAELALLEAGVAPQQIYKAKVISPAQTEKLTKAKKGATPVLPKVIWAKMQDKIIRAEPGAPQIVLESDPRPAIRPATEGFADLDDDFNDLF